MIVVLELIVIPRMEPVSVIKDLEELIAQKRSVKKKNLDSIVNILVLARWKTLKCKLFSYYFVFR